MDYYIWGYDYAADYAQIKKLPQELNDNLWKLHKGIACSDWFPEDITFELDPNSGIKLADSIPNVLHFLIVSDKLKGILNEISSQFEFFPVNILNARGKKTSKPYFLANLVETKNYLDKEKSEYKMSNLDKSQVQYFKKLILDPGKIDKDISMFRLADMTQLIIVSHELAVDIKRNNGCNGPLFVHTEDYR